MRKVLCCALTALLCCALCACSLLYGSAPALTLPPATPTPQPVATPEPTPEPTPAPPYLYISPADAYALLQAGEALVVDLQPQEYYNGSGHIQDALPTFAYPANTIGLQRRLRTALAAVQEAQNVILVDMGGKAGARNASDYYAGEGVAPEKLLILEGGMIAWPYDAMRLVEPAPYELRYMRASAVRKLVRKAAEEPVLLLDLRDTAAFSAGRLQGALSFPAFTGAEESAIDAALAAALPQVRAAKCDIILITADGGEDAAYAYDYLMLRGADAARLYILKDGMNAWPESHMKYVVSDASEAAAAAEAAAAEAAAVTPQEDATSEAPDATLDVPAA